MNALFIPPIPAAAPSVPRFTKYGFVRVGRPRADEVLQSHLDDVNAALELYTRAKELGDEGQMYSAKSRLIDARDALRLYVDTCRAKVGRA